MLQVLVNLVQLSQKTAHYTYQDNVAVLQAPCIAFL